jgi:hypothetical protein
MIAVTVAAQLVELATSNGDLTAGQALVTEAGGR